MKKKTMLLAFLLFLNAAVFPNSEEVIEEIIAIVNDDIITRFEYEEQHQALYQVLRSQLQGDEFDRQYSQLKKNLLETLIRDLLLLQEARKKGLNVQEQVKLNIENIKKEYNIASDEQFIQILQRQGITFEVWKSKMEEDLLKQAVIFTEVDRTIVINDPEIASYYKSHPEEFTEPPEYTLRAIYLFSEGKSEEELQSKMEEISQRLQGGEDMSTLAAQYSEGPEKESQGNLGSFKKGELATPLEEAVVKLKPGETTQWIEIKNGWYLLKLEGKKESRLKSFEEVKKEVETKLFMERKQKKLDEYLKKLREKSYVKILNPNPLEH
ncbi:MAG: peptidyl-prolyl cis-trans isomerase [Candidatus Aminicenantaceae bacterium]